MNAATYLESLRHLPGFDEMEEITVDARLSCGDTPLHVALWQSDGEATKALLEAGADVNAVGEDDYTPLHVAVAQGQAEMVKMLVEAGAAKDVRTLYGDTPRELAALHNHREMLPWLE